MDPAKLLSEAERLAYNANIASNKKENVANANRRELEQALRGSPMGQTLQGVETVTPDNVVALMSNEMISRAITGLKIIYDSTKPTTQAQPHAASLTNFSNEFRASLALYSPKLQKVFDHLPKFCQLTTMDQRQITSGAALEVMALQLVVNGLYDPQREIILLPTGLSIAR